MIAIVDLVVHVIAASVAMSMLPHGFGPTDIHLWSNTIIPAACVIATAIVLVRRERTTPTLVGLGAGSALGFVLVLAQRAPAPSTRPIGGALAEMRGEDTVEEAATGQVVVACG